jgi:hypothetical protein
MTLSGGDALARGARSAQFSAGGSKTDDSVELKNVAPEVGVKFTVTDRRPNYLDSIMSEVNRLNQRSRSSRTKSTPRSSLCSIAFS